MPALREKGTPMLRKLVIYIAAVVLGLLPLLGARVTDRQRTSWQVDKLWTAPNVFGDVWYVDGTNGAAANTGRYPDSAFATLAQALAASAAGDTIIIAPGTYTVDVGTASVAPKSQQHWEAAVIVEGGAPTVIITQDADDNANPLFAVDVDGVVFRGIEFRLVAGGTTAVNLLSAAQTTAARGLTFEDCWFNLNDVDAAVKGILLNDATNAVTGLVMRRCRFTGASATTGQAMHIEIGVGGTLQGLIEDCIFECESADGDAKAINFLDPGASGGSYGITIRNNDFIGPADGGADAVPIAFAAAMTEDEIVGIIRGNFFSNCSVTPITQDEANGSLVQNYVGDDATGGTLVDPGT